MRRWWILWRLLRETYTREGCVVWIRHHRRAGTSLERMIQLADMIRTGAYL